MPAHIRGGRLRNGHDREVFFGIEEYRQRVAEGALLVDYDDTNGHVPPSL